MIWSYMWGISEKPPGQPDRLRWHVTCERSESEPHP
jgi:hypothetical protein